MDNGFYYTYNAKRGIWQQISKEYDQYVKYYISKGKPVVYTIAFPYNASPSIYYDALVK